MAERDPPSLPARLRAVRRGLRVLHAVAQRESTFAEYSGHFLLAFSLIATTSGNRTIRRQALEMGLERARYWTKQWPRTRRALDCDTVMHEVIAAHAAERMGIRNDRIRRDLRAVVARYSPRELLYFDPSRENPPDDVPEDCVRGHVNDRGRKRCRTCRTWLRPRSRYDLWYYALTNTYFCLRLGLPLGVCIDDVVGRLAQLRPYPRPATDDYYDSIFAVTHFVYTLNDYGHSRLSPRLLPHELRFLKASMGWALEQEDPETIGEIVDSLAALGVGDTHPLIVKGRTFLLASQRDDGGWGDEGDEYGYLHTVWTAIDGLRDYRWRGNGVTDRPLLRTLRRLGRGSSEVLKF